MTEFPTSVAVLEPIGSIDNETSELNLKYENLNSHGIQTLKRLDAMRKERQLCDVILSVQGSELFAHRAILSCHSNYFLELFVHDESETLTKKQTYYQIDGIEHAALKLIIQFIYKGSFHFSSDMVPKVYQAAQQLRVETIFKACSNYLIQQLDEHTCLSTRLMAMDDDLRTKATECIENNFLALLETREFHSLPSIKIELIETEPINPNTICDLILNWIVQQLEKENCTIQELSECKHLLYINGDKTLHDCSEMDEQNIYFSDIIKDYQSYKLSKRNLTTSTTPDTSNIPLINNNLSTTIINYLSTFETKFIHIGQSTDHSYIAIVIVKGNMLRVAIHIQPILSQQSNQLENGETINTDKIGDENHLTNGFGPILTADKDAHLASLSTARCGFGLVSTENAIFAVGGYDRGDCLDTIEQYDPNEDKWTLLTIPMTSRRGRVSAAIVKNKIYVCGGSDGQKELNTGEYFDIETMDKWSPIEDLEKPVAHGAMCSDENFVYLIGGCEGDQCNNECYRYDPETNHWSKLNSMHYERSQAAAVHFNGKLYVFGGYTLNRCLSSCEILTLSTNQWSIGPTMRENRRGAGAVVYDNKIFIIGGSNGVTSLTSIEIFDPITNDWLITTNCLLNELNIPRVGVEISLCQNQIYVVGGFDGRNFLKSIEIYDKNSHKWKLTNGKFEKISNQ